MGTTSGQAFGFIDMHHAQCNAERVPCTRQAMQQERGNISYHKTRRLLHEVLVTNGFLSVSGVQD